MYRSKDSFRYLLQDQNNDKIWSGHFRGKWFEKTQGAGIGFTVLQGMFYHHQMSLQTIRIVWKIR